MMRLNAIFLSLLCICFFLSSAQADSLKVPQYWVDLLLKGKNSNDFIWYEEAGETGMSSVSVEKMIRDYNSFVAPDTLQESLNALGILYYEAHDLDEDGEDELVVTLGWHLHLTELAVLKRVEDSWRIIFRREYGGYKNDGDFVVEKSLLIIKNTPFTGSAVYQDFLDFYKLIDGKMRPVLQLLNKTYISGWGNTLGQHVETNFRVVSRRQVDVSYSYQFYGFLDKEDAFGERGQLLLDDKQKVSYLWDHSSLNFQLQPQPRLSLQQIKAMEHLASDSLFIKAFSQELEQIEENGELEKRNLLKEYLRIVEEKRW